ncbi:hypothetical protein [Pelomonas sp. SE-A7]|uniref:hypothetical protein n=1 Tax=Pelomonas sp. SE-A7 TaxID=3054953 RepID=UPI00259C913F|nr:hypothetical protein [Pelomonas sp. SE-A7]MDM4766044.1 hypothetical protein [Pelomonas sp. SE-A7]
MQAKSIVQALLIAAPLTFAGAAALANPQDELKRVEVSGRQTTEMRTDVKASCPSISAVLQKQLSPIWGLHQETGMFRVEFTVDQDGVHDIRSRGANTYRDGIRKAMRELTCNSGSSQPQAYAFNVHIVSPDKTHPTGQVALKID